MSHLRLSSHRMDCTRDRDRTKRGFGREAKDHHRHRLPWTSRSPQYAWTIEVASSILLLPVLQVPCRSSGSQKVLARPTYLTFSSTQARRMALRASCVALLACVESEGRRNSEAEERSYPSSCPHLRCHHQRSSSTLRCAAVPRPLPKFLSLAFWSVSKTERRGREASERLIQR